MRGVVSFSDPLARRTADGRIVFPGHIGLIYQASNAAYLGRSAARTIHLLPDGRVLCGRALQKIRAGEVGWEYAARQLVGAGARPRRAGEDGATFLRRALQEAGVRTVRHPGNHRYAFRIGQQRRSVRLGLDAQPYPKDPAFLSRASTLECC